MKIACHSRNQRGGIALIMVMITIFVLTMLAGAFALSMKVETKLARNVGNETEMVWLGRSGVEFARWVLAQQMAVASEPFDSLNQTWAGGPGSLAASNSPLANISLKDHAIGNGTFSVTITDLERKININQAARDPDLLNQVFIAMGVDSGEYPSIVSSIQDWIDPDNDAHIGGAENRYYQGLNPPYNAKNGPIDDLSEMLLIKGVTPEMYWGTGSTNNPSPITDQQRSAFGTLGPLTYAAGLEQIFTPISSGKVNVNTAPDAMLQLIGQIINDPGFAEDVKNLRAGPDGVDGTEDDTPLHNVGELVNAGVSRQAIAQLSRFCDVRSRTFKVEVDAEIGGYHEYYVGILGRASARDIQVLSFYREKP